MICGMKLICSEVSYLQELTPNTILMCDSSEVKDLITQSIKDSYIKKTEKRVIFNNKQDYLDTVDCKCVLDFPQTTMFDVSDGFPIMITVTVENAFVLQSRDLYDIWFARKKNAGVDDTIDFIPLSSFDHSDLYKSSPISVYKALSVGRFLIDGTYGR